MPNIINYLRAVRKISEVTIEFLYRCVLGNHFRHQIPFL